MHVTTVHTRLHATRDEAFDYLSRVENLPEWSTEFIESAEPGGDGLLARTAVGEASISIRSDRETGVVDIRVTPRGAPTMVFPGRVVALPDGTSDYGFTMIQAPGQSEERFKSELASLEREMEILRRRFDG